MTAQDLAAIVKGVAPAVLQVVSAAVAPLAVKLASLEARVSSIRDGRDGDKGKDAEPVDLEALARKAAELIQVPKDGKDAEAPDVEAVAKVAALLIPVPKDGKDVDPELVESLKAEIVALREQLAASEIRSADFVKEMRDWLSEEVVKAVALIPTPKDGADGAHGQSVTVEDVAPLVTDLVQKAVAEIPPAKDGDPGQAGASVDPADVEAMVVKAVSALPVPTNGRDGQSVTVEDVAPLIAGEVEKAVKALPVPKDGVGLTGALVGHDGRLLVTLSDGSVKDAGPVVGRDVDMAVVQKLIADEIAKFPIPKDGKDGADGIGFDDLEAVFADGVLTHRYKRGEQVLREYTWQAGTPRYVGVFKDGETYQAGQAATWGGSLWIAKSETTAKPGEAGDASRAWQLAVKRGDAGKVGPVGPQGDKGLRGDQGPMGPARY